MASLPDPNQPPVRVVLYQSADGKVTANVLFARDNFWLTQKAMAELFGVKPPAVSKHLKNIFESGELVEPAVVSILETTAADGKNYGVAYYNLDAVIAVGYRVNSLKATHFRIWATNTLREFIVKGFVLNDDQLRPGRASRGRGSPAGSAATRLLSTRCGAMAAVGSTRTQPWSLSQTSAQAWASSWRTSR